MLPKAKLWQQVYVSSDQETETLTLDVEGFLSFLNLLAQDKSMVTFMSLLKQLGSFFLWYASLKSEGKMASKFADISVN